MHWALFYHSLASDWNHGNAHFLRGIASELLARGHQVTVYEPRDGWSRQNLVDQHGAAALEGYHSYYPHLTSVLYDLQSLDLARQLENVDIVVAHEWNDPELIRRLGRHRARHHAMRLFFHDTHHRAVTASDQMGSYDLRHFDGVLAYGQAIADVYPRRGWHESAWTWHEAADVRIFRPIARQRREGDLVWIGNWGDGERTHELQEYLLDPLRQLQLSARIYGVRYPEEGRRAVAAAGAQYGGWLPNYRVPEVFSQFDMTIHIPRRPYREQIDGVPTIRVFEALACGIPLVTLAWHDVEGLFRPGQDFLVARTGKQMRDQLREVLSEPELAASLARSGLETIRSRHTCAHRVDQLLEIVKSVGAGGGVSARAAPPARAPAGTAPRTVPATP